MGRREDLRHLTASVLGRARTLLRPLRLGVRGLVVLRDGNGPERVLLVRHTYVAGWYLPGGGVEAGESAQAALARELREEAGIEIGGTPLLHGLFLNPKGSGRDHVACFVVRDFRVLPRAPDFEIAEADFFPVDALPDATSPATRQRIAEVLRDAPIAEMW